MSALTAEQVRLAIGLITASEWDWEVGDGLNTMRAYLAGCETRTAEDLVWGLVVLCRAVMGTSETDNLSILRRAAERVAAW